MVIISGLIGDGLSPQTSHRPAASAILALLGYEAAHYYLPDGMVASVVREGEKDTELITALEKEGIKVLVDALDADKDVPVKNPEKFPDGFDTTGKTTKKAVADLLRLAEPAVSDAWAVDKSKKAVAVPVIDVGGEIIGG